MMEIHIGVMVSPAPLMTPERLWVTAMAMYPTASMHIMRILRSTSSEVPVKIPIRFLPNSRMRTVITADVPAAIMVPCLAPCSTRS